MIQTTTQAGDPDQACPPYPSHSTVERHRECMVGDRAMLTDTTGRRLLFSFRESPVHSQRLGVPASHLRELRDIVQIGHATLRLAGILSFLVLPQPMLDQRSALDLLLHGDFTSVRAALISAYEGLGG